MKNFRIRISIALLTISTFTFGQVTQQKFIESNKQLDQKMIEYQKLLQNKLLHTTSSYLEYGSETDTIATLLAIQKNLNLLKVNKTKTLIEKYELAQAALEQMEEGAVIIEFINEMLVIHGTIDSAANIWTNTELREGWKNITGGIKTVTPLLTGLSRFISDSSFIDREASLGLGLTVFAIAQGLETWLKNKAEPKIEMINISYRTYDYMLKLNEMLKSYIEVDTIFENRVKNLNLTFETRLVSMPSADKLSNADSLHVAQVMQSEIFEVVNLMDEYEFILQQIPTYLVELHSVLKSKVIDQAKTTPISGQIDLIRDRTKLLEKKYHNKVVVHLRIAPQLKPFLQGI